MHTIKTDSIMEELIKIKGKLIEIDSKLDKDTFHISGGTKNINHVSNGGVGIIESLNPIHKIPYRKYYYKIFQLLIILLLGIILSLSLTSTTSLIYDGYYLYSFLVLFASISLSTLPIVTWYLLEEKRSYIFVYNSELYIDDLKINCKTHEIKECKYLFNCFEVYEKENLEDTIIKRSFYSKTDFDKFNTNFKKS